MDNSKTTKPVKSLRELIEENQLSPEEQEQRQLGAQRLREMLISIPWYQEREKQDPEFWLKLRDSQVNR